MGVLVGLFEFRVIIKYYLSTEKTSSDGKAGILGNGRIDWASARVVAAVQRILRCSSSTGAARFSGGRPRFLQLLSLTLRCTLCFCSAVEKLLSLLSTIYCCFRCFCHSGTRGSRWGWPRTPKAAMEAVGSAATIVQLVSFTGEVLVLGYGYVNRVKKAPSEIRALLRETATLNALLDQLLDLAGSSSENGSFDGALQTLGRLGVFDDCEKLMKVIERNVKACEEVEGERVRNTGRRMAWPFKDKETKDLMVQLGRLREALSAAVMVDSAKSLKELEATAGRVERGVVDAL